MHALNQIAPASLSEATLRLINETRDANQFYQLQEQLVSFAYLAGLDSIWKSHALSLARENRPFRERWARIQSLKNTLTDQSPHG